MENNSNTGRKSIYDEVPNSLGAFTGPSKEQHLASIMDRSAGNAQQRSVDRADGSLAVIIENYSHNLGLIRILINDLTMKLNKLNGFEVTIDKTKSGRIDNENTIHELMSLNDDMKDELAALKQIKDSIMSL